MVSIQNLFKNLITNFIFIPSQIADFFHQRYILKFTCLKLIPAKSQKTNFCANITSCDSHGDYRHGDHLQIGSLCAMRKNFTYEMQLSILNWVMLTVSWTLKPFEKNGYSCDSIFKWPPTNHDSNYPQNAKKILTKCIITWYL